MTLASRRLHFKPANVGRRQLGPGGSCGFRERESQRTATVVIIDDQSTGRKILEELVRTIERNLIVETYAEPDEVLERARVEIPDLVLTDYKMPTMDGVEFTRRFRAIPGCAEVPVVMVTILRPWCVLEIMRNG